jgi:hypothetical protein
MLDTDDVQSDQPGAFVRICYSLWTSGFAIHVEPTSIVTSMGIRVSEVGLTCAIMFGDSFGDSAMVQECALRIHYTDETQYHIARRSDLAEDIEFCDLGFWCSVQDDLRQCARFLGQAGFCDQDCCSWLSCNQYIAIGNMLFGFQI